jgi:hypothetical protein
VASPPPPEPFQPRVILDALVAHEVDFVLIGGLAGMARGSSYPSYDVDVAYERSRENLERLAAALETLGATLRGVPGDVPFLLDAETLENGANFTFDSPYGSLDILSYIVGAPTYDGLKKAAGEKVDVESVGIFVASLDHLIAMKEAAGRTKDILMATEYRVLSDELRAPKDEAY